VTASVSTPAETPAIELTGVVKRYGRTTALAGLDLHVGRGELLGLLGPNGAGKTTTVKLLLGLVRPTAGTGSVLGAPLGDRSARSRIGYLPELFRYQPWLNGREVLGLHARLGRVARPARHEAIERALERVGLSERAGDRVGGFSKGMQQRLGLAVALLGEPELILLDEPTSALDPVGRADVRTIVRDARDRGATVILNSHLLSEVEQVCDRVVILHRGRTIAAGTLDEVVAVDGVRVRVSDTTPAIEAAAATLGPVATTADGWLTVRPLPAERIPDVVAAIVDAGGRVEAVEPGRGSLESRFLELLSDDSADTPAKAS
jgi:ABC-2 type transport system ATP-binding protein